MAEAGCRCTRRRQSSTMAVVEGSRHRPTTGNQLLNRIIRLQAELSRKDMELQSLREQVETAQQNGGVQQTPRDEQQGDVNGDEDDTTAVLQQALETSERQKAQLQVNLSKAEELLFEKEQAISLLSSKQHDQDLNASLTNSWTLADVPPNQHSEALKLTNLNLSICRAFLLVCVADLSELNTRLATTAPPSGSDGNDDSDPLRSLQAALSTPADERYVDYERRCREVLASKGVLPPTTTTATPSGDEATLVDQLIRESHGRFWQPILEQLQLVTPVLCAAVSDARQSQRVSRLFDEWSHEITNQIDQQSPSIGSEFLVESMELLQGRLEAAQLADHWLAPSLSRLVRATSDELKRQLEQRQSGELVDAVLNTDLCLEDVQDLETKLADVKKTEGERERAVANVQAELVELQLEKATLTDELTELRLELETKTVELRSVFATSENQRAELAELRVQHDREVAAADSAAVAETDLLREKLTLAERHLSEHDRRAADDQRTLRDRIDELNTQVIHERNGRADGVASGSGDEDDGSALGVRHFGEPTG